jgi:hypothetical protein
MAEPSRIPAVNIVETNATKHLHDGRSILTTDQFKLDFKLGALSSKGAETLLAIRQGHTTEKSTNPNPDTLKDLSEIPGCACKYEVLHGLDSNFFVVRGNTVYTAPSCSDLTPGTPATRSVSCSVLYMHSSMVWQRIIWLYMDRSCIVWDKFACYGLDVVYGMVLQYGIMVRLGMTCYVMIFECVSVWPVS